MTKSFALSGDLGREAIFAACLLAASSLVLLLIELWRSKKGSSAALRVGVTGALSIAGLLVAVLRPVAIVEKGSLVGPRVLVLADASRSIDLPGIGGTRRQALEQALEQLDRRSGEVRLSLLGFGVGPAFSPATGPVSPHGKPADQVSPSPAASASAASPGAPPPAVGASMGRELKARPLLGSDLGAALESIAKAADERPAAIVVLSDGRLDRPSELSTEGETKAALGNLSVPVHTVALATDAPKDASIRKVLAAGAAVAHQPFSLRVEIGCDGGLSCGDIQVSARELREKGDPTLLATGTAHVVDGKATVELTMTVERAGSRILEIAIDPPAGDTIPENDHRFFTLEVARDRVRVLHVAGRPTYDVRALRMWLKGDASVDVVAFFILRTPDSVVQATNDELALIPFPVDELFTDQLPTFDAVVLQDFNAQPYGLTKHLKQLARYVDRGGGLIMVGGPGSFVGGHYAGTELAPVLPVELDDGKQAANADLAWFTPKPTDAGRMAPVLGPVRALLHEEWPDMPGTNIVGDLRRDATALLVHPTRKTKRGEPMPILALGEHGSGRTIALSVDGSHRLLFSDFAAKDAGRAHGAFWDSMLGWLMRDPRFEPAVIDVKGGCIAGVDATLVLRPLAGQKGPATITLQRLGTGDKVRTLKAELDGTGKNV